jgi:hypothetical protein
VINPSAAVSDVSNPSSINPAAARDAEMACAKDRIIYRSENGSREFVVTAIGRGSGARRGDTAEVWKVQVNGEIAYVNFLAHDTHKPGEPPKGTQPLPHSSAKLVTQEYETVIKLKWRAARFPRSTNLESYLPLHGGPLSESWVLACPSGGPS